MRANAWPASRDPHRGTPGNHLAGGHRSRVPPVPIPNTEVKPATADGTMWATAWESRSLPAVIPRVDVTRRRPFSCGSRAVLRDESGGAAGVGDAEQEREGETDEELPA